ncbi:winged helix DNA-binding protein, partial [Schumannella luteola]
AQTMGELVAALDARGLIERHPDPRSRRQNLIRLTADGRRVLEALREPVAQLEQRMTAQTSASRVATARAALEAWRDALSAPDD